MSKRKQKSEPLAQRRIAGRGVFPFEDLNQETEVEVVVVERKKKPKKGQYRHRALRASRVGGKMTYQRTDLEAEGKDGDRDA